MGVPLGALLGAGFLIQAIGLETTSAAHGAVTGTFTVITVPFITGALGLRIPGIVWASAFTALAGDPSVVAGSLPPAVLGQYGGGIPSAHGRSTDLQRNVASQASGYSWATGAGSPTGETSSASCRQCSSASTST